MPNPMSVEFAATRCLLFAPGMRPDRFAKALAACRDGIVLDLEDAVAPGDKDAARRHVADFLAARREAGPPILVRINALGTRPGLSDLAAIADGVLSADGLVLPKVEDPRDVVLVRSLLGPAAPPLLAVIETARGLGCAEAIADAVGETGALGFGGADLAADLGCELAWEPMLAARSRIVAAAARYRLSSFDVPFLALDDAAGLAAEASRVRTLGFTGKLAIHPAQVAPIIAAFTPSPEAADAARRIVSAFESAGGKAIQVDGRMVDVPLYQSALRVLRRAGAA